MRGQPLRTREELVRHNIETQVHPENVALNPQRYLDQYNRLWARRQVLLAVKSGVLVKPSLCSECGLGPLPNHEVQGHHRDYGKPLDVEWLCGGCHYKRHRGRYFLDG